MVTFYRPRSVHPRGFTSLVSTGVVVRMKPETKAIKERGERRLLERDCDTPMWTDYQRCSFQKLMLQAEVAQLKAIIAGLRQQLINSECAGE